MKPSVADGPSTHPTTGVDLGGIHEPPWLNATRLIVGVIFLAAIVAIVSHLGEARHFAEIAKRARPAWLMVAAALQAATYFCAGGIWWIVLRRAPCPQPLWALVRLSVGKLFLDQTLPSGGVTGNALMLRGVVRRGAPEPTARAALVIGLIGFYAATVLATAGSLLGLGIRHHVSVALVVLSCMLLVVAACVCTLLIVLVRGERTHLRRWLSRIPPVGRLLDSFAQVPREVTHDRVSLAGSFGLQLANIALDAATLQTMLAAVGERVDPSSVFTSFVFASIAEMIGIVPGGLGTFEGTCVALLHLSGVDLEPALAATLLFRGFTFWIPMIPGMGIVRREIGSPARPGIA